MTEYLNPSSESSVNGPRPIGLHSRASIPVSPPRRGFTFTEILIALALIIVLLVGVSQVFTVTGETISRSQAFSNAMRAQRAVQQTLATDILGVDPDSSSNGIVPFVTNQPISSPRQPFLIISNHRVPAYLNPTDEREDVERAESSASFGVRSEAVRRVDLDGDGSIGPNERLSIFDIGLRNFRTDTITFFGRGQFTRQIPEQGLSPSQLTCGEAMIHYGHLRLFNGEQDKRNDADEGYGPPGYPNTLLTGAGRPNRNNRYAEQFALGRSQFLLRDYVVAGSPPQRVVIDDTGSWIRHVARQWESVTENLTQRTPFDIRLSGVSRGTSVNWIDSQSDAQGAGYGSSARLMDMRTDVLGISLDVARQRIAAQQFNDPTFAWWNELPGRSFTDRFLADVNPVRPYTASNLSQRHHVLAQACTQFIVEFAGDFFTQNDSGVVTGIVEPGPLGWINEPDGIDYQIDPETDRRSIRWYGMPRDVDGDGVIGGPLAAHHVRDVLPVRDFATRAGVNFSVPRPSFPFERSLPNFNVNYANALNEPGVSPDASSYVCAWGQYEMAHDGGIRPSTFPNAFFAGVPSLIRITVEIRDPNNRLADPVIQQYVFPLRQ